MARSLVIPSIFTAVDKFSGPVSKMSKNTDVAFARMERKLRKVGDTAFRVGRKSAGIGLAIAAPLGLLANEAVKFEEKMSNVSTLVDTTNESMDKMGEEVLSLSKKLPVPIDQLTESLYDVRSAGIAAEDAMATLESSAILAKTGLGSVQEATNITTSALNAFASEGLTSSETIDILFKTVKSGKNTIAELSQAFGANASIIKSMNVTLPDYSAATAALTVSGIPAAQAQNQIKASLVALLKPTAQMKKVFDELNVASGKDLVASSGSLVAAFDEINKATEKLGLNQGDVFSRTEGLAAVLSLTGEANKNYTDTLFDMREGANAVDKAFEKQMKTGKASMQIAKNSMQALGITLGKALIPLINDLVKAVSPMIEKFSSWVKNNKSTVATILKVAAVVAGLAFAISGISFVVGIAAKAMMVFNSVFLANPIILVGAAVAYLGYEIYKVVGSFNKLSRSERLHNEVSARALENTIEQRVEVRRLFQTLRKAEDGTDAYKAALKRVEEIQPGITEKYDLQRKSVDALNTAEKSLTETIMRRAKGQAAEELAVEKTKEAFKLMEQEVSTMDILFTSPSDLFSQGTFDPVTAIKNKRQQEAQSLLADADRLSVMAADFQAISTQQTISATTTNKEKVEVVIKNETGNNVSVSGTSGAHWFMPGLGNTNGG